MIAITLRELRAMRYRPGRGPLRGVECPIVADIAPALAARYGDAPIPLSVLAELVRPTIVGEVLDRRWIVGGREVTRDLAVRLARRACAILADHERDVAVRSLDSGIPLTTEERRAIYHADDTPHARRINHALRCLSEAHTVASAAAHLATASISCHGHPDEVDAQRADLLEVLRHHESIGADVDPIRAYRARVVAWLRDLSEVEPRDQYWRGIRDGIRRAADDLERGVGAVEGSAARAITDPPPSR
jgi:hypothetical protein